MTSPELMIEDRYTACWVQSLNELGRDRWNAIAARCGFYSSFDWLIAEEPNTWVSVRYLVVLDDAQTLVAGLPVYEVHRETNPRYLPAELGIAAAADGKLALGNRRGYRSGLPMLAGLAAEQVAAVTGCLAAELAVVRAEAGSTPIWYYVPDEALAPVLALAPGQQPVQIGTEASIEVSDDGFDGYSERLPGHRRRRIRAERRAFLAAGYQLGVEVLAEVADEAAPLLEQLETRYGKSSGLDNLRLYYRRLGALSEPGSVLTCRDGGRLVGFCHFYEFAGTVWARSAGFDYANLRGAYEYFNVVYYELIELAARTGAGAVHLGMESMDAKLLRGARPERLWAVPFGPVTSPGPVTSTGPVR